MIFNELNEDNFLLFAIKNYENPQAVTKEDFDKDLNHFKYIKRLLRRYETTGELKSRRDFRLREELREIVARRLEQRAREICTGEVWDGLQTQVLDKTLDPWSAADEMLRGVGA